MRGEKPEWEPLGELPLAEFSPEELLEEREDPAEAGAAKPERKPPARPKAAKKQQQEDLHAGHRDRLRQRFLQEGLEHFEDHTILELLLFYAIPQRDTNELAHRLIREFGSFSQVFLADYERLAAVKGMTGNAAVLLKLIPPLFGRYLDRMQDAEELLNSSEKVGNYLIPKFLGQTEEMVYLLCFNNACRLLRCEKLSAGGLSRSGIDVRKLAETAFQCKAVNVVLAHNHPHGLARPSSQDVRVTEWLYAVLKPLGIELMDHFVVAGGEYVSMMEMGYLGLKQEGVQDLT